MKIFFDTETTGLSPDYDEILQLAIIDDSGNTLWNKFYKPEHHVRWPYAQQKNGISPQLVSSAPNIKDDLQEIQDIFDQADRFFAYNAAFDVSFLRNLGITIPAARVIDTMKVYAAVFHNYQICKLEDAARECGYTYHAHDALEDSRATLVVQFKADDNSTIPTFYDGVEQESGEDVDKGNAKKNRHLVLYTAALLLLAISFVVHPLFLVSVPLLLYTIGKSGNTEGKKKKTTTKPVHSSRTTIDITRAAFSVPRKESNPAQPGQILINNPWVFDDVSPVNSKPAGNSITIIETGITVVGAHDHQSALKTYGYDAWLWVYVTEGIIPKGKNLGYSTYFVYLDGEEIGYITKYQMEKHIGQVPESGAVMIAHIPNNEKDKKRKRYGLRLQMPAAHEPSPLPAPKLPEQNTPIAKVKSNKPQIPSEVDSAVFDFGKAISQIEKAELQRQGDFINPKPHLKTLSGASELIEVPFTEEGIVFAQSFDTNVKLWVKTKAYGQQLLIIFNGTVIAQTELPAEGDYSQQLVTEGSLVNSDNNTHFFVRLYTVNKVEELRTA